MKTFCMYSGLVIHEDTCLNNLGLDRKLLARPSEHAAFSYSLSQIITMASFKPFYYMTRKQRHLLAVAMLRHTGLVDFRFPITQADFADAEVQKGFKLLLDSCYAISLNSKHWRNHIVPNMPRLEIRKDNHDQIDYLSFIKEILYPSTFTLTLRRQVREDTKDFKLEEEINLERELKKTLRENWGNRKTVEYTVSMGKWVLEELWQALANRSIQVPLDQRKEALSILSTPKDKLKVSSIRVAKLRELIKEHVTFSLGPEDTKVRTYVSLTLKYLDTQIEFLNSVASLFGAITVPVKPDLPENSPTDYTIKTYVVNPFPTLDGHRIPPKNPNVVESKNAFIQALLAKRKAATNGNSEEGNNE